MKKQLSHSLDFLGISSATLCLIHCVLFPLLALIPVGISHNHWIDLLFVMIGLYAVVKILKTNVQKYIKAILLIYMSQNSFQKFAMITQARYFMLSP